jgi:hypothetical protein
VRVLDRDHRLICEGGGQLYFLFRERFDMRAIDHEYPDKRILSQQRNAKHRAVALNLLSLPATVF